LLKENTSKNEALKKRNVWKGKPKIISPARIRISIICHEAMEVLLLDFIHSSIN
jgi:hypothetical protein